MTDVFVKRLDKGQPYYAGLPLIHLVGASLKTGEIGIEIEVEGNKFPKSGGYEVDPDEPKKIPKQWKYHQDGSLRGEDNAEYVLAKPIKFSEVEKAVTDLWKMFEDFGSVLTESNRTSVHVHLNVQQFYLNRLCSFMGMYFVLEELLTAWCGDHRVGNLFCLRGRDAPAIIRRLKEFFQKDGYGFEFSSGMHYAGLNPSAIHKFGSVEIRSLRGVNDPKIILDWVSVLERLYTLSADFKDPREVVAGFSGNGPIVWLQGILGDKFSTIMNNVPYTTDEVRDILYNGIRLAQDLCYCRDWSEYKEQKVEDNPFGRNKIKFASSPSSSVQTQYYTTGMSLNTVSSGLAATPQQSTSYPPTQLVCKIQELYEGGYIDQTMYNHLNISSFSFIESWLINNGYLPPVVTTPSEPEPDEYIPDDDYFDEDDD